MLLAVLAVSLLGTSCRGPRGFVTPYGDDMIRTGRAGVEDRDTLLARLRERASYPEEIWLRSRVTVRYEDRGGSDFFTAVVMYREPGQLRLGGSRSPIGNLFDVLVSGDMVSLYFHREGQQFVGTLDDLARQTGAVGALSPRELLAAVLVQQELRRHLEGYEPVVVRRRGDDHLLVAARHSPSGRQLLWLVRRKDGLVEEMVARDPDGSEEVRVRYREYRLYSHPDREWEEPLPYRFDLTVPAEGIEVELRVTEYRLAPGLTDRSFQPPRAREVYALRDLVFEEAK